MYQTIDDDHDDDEGEYRGGRNIDDKRAPLPTFGKVGVAKKNTQPLGASLSPGNYTIEIEYRVRTMDFIINGEEYGILDLSGRRLQAAWECVKRHHPNELTKIRDELLDNGRDEIKAQVEPRVKAAVVVSL